MPVPPAPVPVVPMPAAQFSQLRGRRVIVGVPGVGFRGDLRADDAVVHGSRTYVPVLTEQDYYRAETDQIEVFAPLVPINRVWVEHIPPLHAPVGSSSVTLDAPLTRQPIAVEAAHHVIGCRVVQAVPDGFVRDLRAVTDTYLSANGTLCVRVCGEAEWYKWGLGGTTPSTSEIAVTALWLE
jgi:hypothetical protein